MGDSILYILSCVRNTLTMKIKSYEIIIFEIYKYRIFFYFKLFHITFNCSLSLLTCSKKLLFSVVFTCFLFLFFCIAIKRPCNILQYITDVKMTIFRRKTEIVFFFFAQNVDCGYTLDPAKIEKYVYPCKPQFYYIKMGGNGVYITRTCYPDVSFLRSYKCIYLRPHQPVFLLSLLSAPCRLETFSHVSSC